MTWGEFKQLMTERGVCDDDVIEYIDAVLLDGPELRVERYISTAKPEGWRTTVET